MNFSIRSVMTAAQDAYAQNDDSSKRSIFREAFKFYRRRGKDADLSNVLDLRVGNDYIGLRCVPVHSNVDVSHIPGLRPTNEWTLTTLDTRPGLYVLNDIFTKDGQLDWMQNCLLKYAEPPNVTNMHVDKSYFGENVFVEKGQKLRWVTMGNDYNWTDKVYADKPRDQMPSGMIDLGLAVSKILQLDELRVDAAILNFYPEKSNLSPHVDRSERSIEKPLISISLGQDAIYLTGGKTMDDPVDALHLQSGDVLVMHGEQRLVYHGVPRILATRKFVDERKAINSKVLDYVNKCRINITLRQVD
ncbi:Fe2OG dioxygenase domain-containing protein [Aphelenchoides bicaudatus]|nr:Fe2OG dioxygenase domain-containing protein [Aphelenchoides bicaudatus]